jgi:hypothetical protein
MPQASYPVVLHKVEPRGDADDARDFTFRFQDPKQCADFLQEATITGALGSAWHIGLCVSDTEREYTPLTSLEDAARTMSLTLLIRLYQDGEMSQKLRAMCPGAAADISCPRPTFGLSSWIIPTLNPAPDLWSAIADNSARLGMICAGTGVAVGYQALRLVVEALARRAEPAASNGVGPRVGLLCSHRESCPLMVDELDSVAQAANGAGRLRLTLTANLEVPQKRVRSERSAHAVSLFRGRVDESMLRDVLPVCSQAPCLIVVTGPRGFNEHCTRLLSRLGHADSHIIVLDA